MGKLVDSSTPLSKGKDKSAPCIQFETRRAAEKMVRMRLFEGLEAGSRVYTLSDHVIEVPARCVHVLKCHWSRFGAAVGLRATSSRPSCVTD